jgi:hypothetical protein
MAQRAEIKAGSSVSGQPGWNLLMKPGLDISVFCIGSMSNREIP